MKLFEFFSQDNEVPKHTIIFMSTIAGISGGVLLAIINTAAEMASNNEALTHYFLLYITTLILFAYARKTAFFKTVTAAEATIRKIRVRISDKIRHSELDFIESTGKSHIYTALTQDISLISQSVFSLLIATQSTVIILFSFFYIAWLS